MGGRDIPASGFALYLDPLMDLIRPTTPDETPTQRILIRAQTNQPEAVKDVFRIASCLREAGYTAELDLGSREQANLQWALDIRTEAPLFVLTDQTNQKKFEAQSADEVLAILGME